MTGTRRRTFFVECYAPGIERGDAEADGVRARAAAQALADVEYVNAILVPGDEVVFHVFRAEDAESVRRASVRAELPFERIVESLSVGVDGAPGAAMTAPRARCEDKEEPYSTVE